MARENDSDSDQSGGGGGGKGKGKARRELPAGAVATLKAWLLSPEHFTHPYPTPQDQIMLMQQTGIDKKQLKNWFTNARRRIWKPMLKKQLEQGKLAATGTGSGVALPGAIPGVLPVPAAGETVETHSAQAMQSHYQQAVQQQDSTQQVHFVCVDVDGGVAVIYVFSLFLFAIHSHFAVRCVWQSSVSAADPLSAQPSRCFAV